MKVKSLILYAALICFLVPLRAQGNTLGSGDFLHTIIRGHPERENSGGRSEDVDPVRGSSGGRSEGVDPVRGSSGGKPVRTVRDGTPVYTITDSVSAHNVTDDDSVSESYDKEPVRKIFGDKSGDGDFVRGSSGNDPVAVAAARLTQPPMREIIHRIGVEIHPSKIVRDNKIPQVNLDVWDPRGASFSTHLKYSFQFHPQTVVGRTYAGAYQGIGMGVFNFGHGGMLGTPVALYLFQGAHIARFAPRFTLDYEWNFGLSLPWNAYNPETNPDNWVVGSKVNAYINADFYLNYNISRRISLAAGISLSHFSNGNTRFPNAGLNTFGGKFGITYNLNDRNGACFEKIYRSSIPDFPTHVSYDLVLFGSWRKRGIMTEENTFILPGNYNVLGMSFSPMYNFNHNLRAGMALDAFYDSSANLIFEDQIVEWGEIPDNEIVLHKPGFGKQVALGVSGRVEFVMPYFIIGLGVGTNILHGGGDMKSVYQILALKIEITRNSFVHVGYSLHNFKSPNFLMLGMGFRFNNRSPLPYHSGN